MTTKSGNKAMSRSDSQHLDPGTRKIWVANSAAPALQLLDLPIRFRPSHPRRGVHSLQLVAFAILLGSTLSFGQATSQTAPHSTSQTTVRTTQQPSKSAGTTAKPPANPPAPAVDMIGKCRAVLSDGVNDRNPDGRKSAAEALSLMGVKDDALQFLSPMLNDKDVAVRVAVVNSLGDLKDKQAIPLLKQALQDPVPEVDFTAAKVLEQLHDPEGEKFLLEVTKGESKASSNYFTKEKRTALHMLHTPTKLVIFIGISAAGLAPVPGLGFGLSSAQGILMDPDASARAASLLLIGTSRDPALADVVASSLDDKEWSVRAAAAHLVATHPFPAYREKLLPLLDDKKQAVRLRAAAAYIRLAPEIKPLPVRKRTVKSH